MITARFVKKNAATTIFAGYAGRNLNCGPEIATEGLGPEHRKRRPRPQPEAQWSPRIGLGGVVFATREWMSINYSPGPLSVPGAVVRVECGRTRGRLATNPRPSVVSPDR
jgi:hypothetical protein